MGVLGKVSKVVLDESARMQRMSDLGMKRGYWRGGKSVADGPYYTPDKEAAENFAKRHGAGADVREYALRLGNTFDFREPVSDVSSISNVLRTRGMSKLADDVDELPVDWDGELPSPMLYQILDIHTGEPQDILREAGFDTINAGQEVITLHDRGLVRDAERAQFDPSKKFDPNPFAAVSGAAVGLGAAGKSEAGPTAKELIDAYNQKDTSPKAYNVPHSKMYRLADLIDEYTESPMGGSWFEGVTDWMRETAEGRDENYWEKYKRGLNAALDFL